MFYCAHNSQMDAFRYVYFYVNSGIFHQRMFYCAHHSHMYASQYVHVDVFPRSCRHCMLYFVHRSEKTIANTCLYTFCLLSPLNVSLHSSQLYGRSPCMYTLSNCRVLSSLHDFCAHYNHVYTPHYVCADVLSRSFHK